MQSRDGHGPGLMARGPALRQLSTGIQPCESKNPSGETHKEVIAQEGWHPFLTSPRSFSRQPLSSALVQ